MDDEYVRAILESINDNLDLLIERQNSLRREMRAMHSDLAATTENNRWLMDRSTV